MAQCPACMSAWAQARDEVDNAIESNAVELARRRMTEVSSQVPTRLGFATTWKLVFGSVAVSTLCLVIVWPGSNSTVDTMGFVSTIDVYKPKQSVKNWHCTIHKTTQDRSENSENPGGSPRGAETRTESSTTGRLLLYRIDTNKQKTIIHSRTGRRVKHTDSIGISYRSSLCQELEIYAEKHNSGESYMLLPSTPIHRNLNSKRSEILGGINLRPLTPGLWKICGKFSRIKEPHCNDVEFEAP